MQAIIDRDHVRALPLFSRMPEAALDAMLAASSRRQFAVGAAVFEQGEPAAAFFVLLSGRLRVTRVTAEGAQTIVRMVSPGDLFGIARALRRTDYPGTATAVSESTALRWPMRLWDELLGQNPALAVNAMQTMGDRLQEAQARVQEMATEQVERRVAHTVLRLAAQAGRKEADGIRIDFPISKQDIAELSGTTLHTVSRILSAWEDAGLIEGGRQKLLIRQAHRLVLIGDGVVAGYL